MNKSVQIEKIINNLQAFKRAVAAENHCFDSGLKITMSQTMFLFMLRNNGPMSFTEIAKMLGVSKSAVTQLVDGIARYGFLVREADKSDHRVSRVKLSTKGLKYIKTTKQGAMDRMSAIFQSLSKEELNQLEKITTKLFETKNKDLKCQN
jgi:DNA-binding MarR family transcriptional regulator